jgi:hypothetical protein
MIHTEQLCFSYEHTDFEATVTYSDLPLRASSRDRSSVFWNVTLHQPEYLECGGEVKRLQGMARMILATKAGDRHFVYVPDPDYEEKEDEINIFPKAVEKILYCYFNQARIAHYREKIKCFNEAIEKKYAPLIETQRAKRRVLRQQMRAGEITTDQYQKLYRPIRLEKERLEMKLSWTKHLYERRYFECCELRGRYRVFGTQKAKRCFDAFHWCDTAWIVKYRDEVSDDDVSQK